MTGSGIVLENGSYASITNCVITSNDTHFYDTKIYNTASPDKTIYVPNSTYDDYRAMFCNCAIPEELKLDKYWPSFDIVQLASWSNPVSSSVKDSAIDAVNITDTEPNKSLTWTTSGDIPDSITVSRTKTSFTFEGSPSTAGDHIFAVTASNNKGSSTVTAKMTVYEAPVFTDTEVSVNAVENSEITARVITPEAGNHLVWTVSGDVPAGLSVIRDDMSITVSGTPTTAGASFALSLPRISQTHHVP